MKGHTKRSILLLTLLIAFALRTVSLDWQSFWVDEVYSVYFIDRSLQETFNLIINPRNNGPLYFLLLWFWDHAAGSSDFSLRYLSVLFSVLTVAGMWALAHRKFGPRVAAVTTVLLAISPFAVWYGQEARMYALHMFLVILSTLFLIRALSKSSISRWFGYGIAINLLGYSHFFGAFTIAAQGIATVLTTVTKPKKLRNYIITMLLIAWPYVAVVRYAVDLIPSFTLQDNSKGFVPLHQMVKALFSEYTLRTSWVSVDHIGLLIAVAGGLILLGLWEAWRRDWRYGVWIASLMILPTLIFYPISFEVPVFKPKYLSATYLPFVLAMALGIERIRHYWRYGAAAALIGISLFAGWINLRIVRDPVYQRSDWKALAVFLEDHVHPEDAVVAYAHYTDQAINRYYDGSAPVYQFGGDPYNPQPFYQALQQDQNVDRLWLILHHDQAMAPENRLQDVADELYPTITGVYPNNGQIRVLGYNLRWCFDHLPPSAEPLNVKFENGWALVGYHVDYRTLKPTDSTLHPPSNWIHVTTYWRNPDQTEPHRHYPLVRLIDDQAQVWGQELELSKTAFDFNGRSGGCDNTDLIEVHSDVNLNPITPEGRYQLVVGLEEKDDRGERDRVPLESGQSEMPLTEIEIVQ